MTKDHVKCCNCGFKGLVEMGQEVCPQCEREGMLAWVNENKQEVID